MREAQDTFPKTRASCLDTHDTIHDTRDTIPKPQDTMREPRDTILEPRDRDARDFLHRVAGVPNSIKI